MFESPVNFSWWEPFIVLYKEVLSSQLGKLHFLSGHILESREKITVGFNIFWPKDLMTRNEFYLITDIRAGIILY